MSPKRPPHRRGKRRTLLLLSFETWVVPIILLVVGIAGRPALDTEMQKTLLTVGCIVPIPFYLMFVMWIRYRK